MKIYISNYRTMTDHEAEMGDPPARDMGLADFSAPDFCKIGTNWRVVLDETKAELLDSIKEGYEDDPNWQEGVGWSEHGWQQDCNRPHKIMDLMDNDGVLATIIIQELEVK